MMALFGWIGSIILTFSALPEVIKSLKTGRCDMTWSFLLMWIGGEIMVLVPIIAESMAFWLLFNYLTNASLCAILIITKLKQKRRL